MDIRFDILITQMFGFLIVFWVLKRYAWGPLLAMLEERRVRIAGEVATTERLRREAEELKTEFENQLKHIEAQARQRIQEAVAEGQEVAEEIKAAAHREAQVITQKAKASVEMEYKKARVALRAEIVNTALGAAGQLLEKSLDTAEHRRMVDRFLTELEKQKAQ
jgi:F-type H+-transporting ATPase subunit b